MTDKLWKRAERKIAELIGGKRVPITGRQRGSAPDIQHPILSIEVKHRQNIPSWILDAYDQAQKSRISDQVPVVMLHKKGMKYEDCLTFIKLSDLVEMLNKVEKLETKIEILQDDIRAMEETR